jgi:hypothetical protein
MSELSHVEFLMAIIKHTTNGKPNLPALSKALNLNPSATSMRMTRLKKKLASGETIKITSKDTEFLENVVKYSEGKTDLKGLAQDCGLKAGAVSMRLTRLRKKWQTLDESGHGEGGGRRKRGVEKVRHVGSGEGGIKVEAVEIKVEFEDEGY